MLDKSLHELLGIFSIVLNEVAEDALPVRVLEVEDVVLKLIKLIRSYIS